jgi:hypothetical protein
VLESQSNCLIKNLGSTFELIYDFYF